MNITFQIESLRQLTRELLNLGVDGLPVYADRFSQLSKEVLEKADALYAYKGATLEEEALLCLSLLVGYESTIYDHGDKEQKKQFLLDRSWQVLEGLPSSLLRCQLLIACYAEVFSEDLAAEAHAIIDSWSGRELSAEEQEAVESLKNVEENPYPNFELD